MALQAKKKGNRGELELVHILNERFGGKLFARAVSSGAWIGGANRGRAETLTEEQQLAFASDIICPVNFFGVIEHKSYSKLDFWELFNDKSNLKQWFSQVESDANFVGKKPILIVKINNHKRIVFLKEKIDNPVFIIGEWNCLLLSDLLNLPDEFFFNKDKDKGIGEK